jgi:hypothetical protein
VEKHQAIQLTTSLACGYRGVKACPLTTLQLEFRRSVRTGATRTQHLTKRGSLRKKSVAFCWTKALLTRKAFKARIACTP